MVYQETADVAIVFLLIWIIERLRRVAIRELEKAARPTTFIHFDRR